MWHRTRSCFLWSSNESKCSSSYKNQEVNLKKMWGELVRNRCQGHSKAHCNTNGLLANQGGLPLSIESQSSWQNGSSWLDQMIRNMWMEFTYKYAYFIKCIFGKCKSYSGSNPVKPAYLTNIWRQVMFAFPWSLQGSGYQEHSCHSSGSSAHMGATAILRIVSF